MRLNRFAKRIIYDGRIYLVLEDCAAVLETSVEDLEKLDPEITLINGIGKCISEDTFNAVLAEHFPDAPTVAQLTYVDSLDVKAEEILKTYPLKRLFGEEAFMLRAGEFGLSVEEYINQVDFPEEVEKERARIRLQEDSESKIRKYKEELRKGIEAVKNIPFEKFGIQLQHLSVIEKGRICFRTYYAGEGIFWSIMPDMMGDDIWEEATIKSDGTIVVPSPDCSEGYVKFSREVDRDFRNYSVIDNILYCVKNIEAVDEWTDFIEISKGGVNISVSKMFLMKLVNSRNCRDVYYIEGVL